MPAELIVDTMCSGTAGMLFQGVAVHYGLIIDASLDDGTVTPALARDEYLNAIFLTAFRFSRSCSRGGGSRIPRSRGCCGRGRGYGGRSARSRFQGRSGRGRGLIGIAYAVIGLVQAATGPYPYIRRFTDNVLSSAPAKNDQ